MKNGSWFHVLGTVVFVFVCFLVASVFVGCGVTGFFRSLHISYCHIIEDLQHVWGPRLKINRKWLNSVVAFMD